MDEMNRNIAEIGGVNVQAFSSLDEFATQILPDKDSLTSGFAVAINPEKVMTIRKDAETRRAVESATVRYADGVGVVWAMRRKGINAPRVTGCDLWERLMHRAAEFEVPVSLLGARPEVLEKTVARLRSEFPSLDIAACQHGYATEAEHAEFVRRLRKMGRGIVAVAMGSPRQEKMISSLRAFCPDAFYMGVGGTFDCYAGAVRRAPATWQKLNLEWFYRLIRQPWRIKRQWIYVPYAALVLAGQV
jgi:UDP-N-acetyl-D-mannosaminouronate:lipid I N-acetyl-D-mannosaminouronosyltransferase